ncbi:MAG: sialate O-acetylesterase [Pirellulaceae bacterium]|nr:sialate O-acetylesterase [Pirellulaceae bacterium]
MYRAMTLTFFMLLLSSQARAESDKSIRVFVLAGQSNMVGTGQIALDLKRNDGRGSLEWLVHEPSKAAQFEHLVDADQNWVVRDDVQIWFLDRKGGLAPGYGGGETTIGPELGFGCVVGDAIDNPILLIKLAWGGKSLGRDFRPPSSGGEVGPYYKNVIETTRKVMNDVGELFPQFAGKKLELAGFGWHQGWNDRVNQKLNDEYQQNMANFIRDVRKEFNHPGLPFVIAETGMSGHKEKHPRALSLMAAQAAVAEQKGFQGNVAFVGTRDFYRPPEVSPARQAYHWNRNAETYYLIGQGMGQAMLRLMNRE